MLLSICRNLYFLFLADCEFPFLTSVIQFLSVILGEIFLKSLVLLTAWRMKYQGIIALTSCYISLDLSMRFVSYMDIGDKADHL